MGSLNKDIQIWPLKTPTLPPATTTNTICVGEKTCFIIDPATPYPEEQNQLLRLLATAIKEGKKPKGILLTHHHHDHIGAASFLKEKFKLPIWCHEETSKLLDFSVDHLVFDRQQIDDLLAIWTPGHAKGHLCFFHEKSSTLIAGDMVAGVGSIIIDPSQGDMKTYVASLQRLLEFRAKHLIPAHGPTIHNVEEKLKKYIEHRYLRKHQVFAALLNAGEKGLSTLELANMFYANQVPKSMLWLAERSLLSTLNWLIEEGNATKCVSTKSEVALFYRKK